MGSYQKSKGRSNKSKFVQLPEHLLKSDAYRSLSFKSIAAYIEIKRRYNGANNGEVHLSCRSAGEALRCTPNTASKAIKELEEKGFVKCRFKGKFDHKVHQASEFILTEYKYNNQPPTKDFMRWKPEP